MKRQIRFWGILFFIMSFFLGGCTDTKIMDTQVKTNMSDTQQTEAVKDIVCPHTQYLTDEMYEQATSFVQEDMTRLAAVMRKAMYGEDITIGVIGGSITEGCGASKKENAYAALMKDWWQERFPAITVNYINAGIGGTTSYLGVHRVQEQLLDAKPDFVIIEFSVNDENNLFYKKTYENLVRRVMQSENQPAVMLLFMTQESGYCAQTNDALIGFKYGLPMISYANAIHYAVDHELLSWSKISADGVHPNDVGHAIIGEMMDRYLNDIYDRLDEIPTEIKPFAVDVITKESYMDAKILDNTSIAPKEYGSFEEKEVNSYFPSDWQCTGGEKGIVFEVEAANIGIAYQKQVDGTYGQFDVYVDGELMRTLDGNFANGWGAAIESVEIYSSDTAAVHTVEIRKNPNATGELFTVLGLLIS